MSQSSSRKSEDPFSPGEQSILPGEQSGGDVVAGSTRGNGNVNGSGVDITDGTREAREAGLATFRSSLRTGEMQYDEQVLYDTTPEEAASPMYGGMEGYEVSYEVGEGGGADQDGYNNEMIEENGANPDDYSNEASKDDYDHEMSEDDDEANREDDDYDQYELNNATFLALPAQGGSPSDPPSGSEYDGDETRFVARLAGALQQAADNGEVVIADSQAGSDDMDDTANYATSWSNVKMEEDPQADLDDFENIPNYAASSGDQDMADSQAFYDDLENANHAAPRSELEAADSQADPKELVDNAGNYFASFSDQEMADWQADSGNLDNNTANHADASSDLEVADSQDDSDDLEINADEAASSSYQEMTDSQAGSDDPNTTAHHAASSSDEETSDSEADSDDLDSDADDADSSSDKEIADSQADSDKPAVPYETSDSDADSDSDSDADTIILSPLNRKRLAPVRTLYNRRIDPNPDSDPDSSSSDGDSDSSSSLTELEKTPVPEDPVLRRLEREFKQRTLKRCNCLGWCECTRYSTYYGSWAVRGEGGGLLVPSQTHLSEYALSNERFPTSAMRSTIAAEERYEERRERAFSWDRMRKPTLAPVGWVGEEW
jgi:hypothetical protein